MEKVGSILSSNFRGTRVEPPITVSSIFIYPIKSCKGISVPQACISATGFRWDRQWMVVNCKGRAYTQRTESKLALVEVELPKEAFNEGWEPTNNSCLVLRAPGMDVLEVPLKEPPETINEVSVWEWSGSALNQGNKASEWFSKYLEKQSCLVRFDSVRETRDVDSKYARGYKATFSDGYPFMLISQGSLNALNDLLKAPLKINRFRPNILVDGCEPFAEDLWKTIRIRNLNFLGVKLCSRCKVPTINQETGLVSDREPTDTLMTFRSGQDLHLASGKKNKVYFGQNLVCKESLTTCRKGLVIKVGDPVYVLEKVSSSSEAAA